ncbi:heme peroxidase [Rhizoctonia solani]|uniref:Heme peroxidase n=1 Tax=Rhizoctonia solani TaxID=456999 RepID=A0A8H8NTV7_9AGAM|nr:heme peroxidase [Rhizoctonia solani]QRW19936.1 heme peroxidase [Rhizoctonia solani]
MSPYHSGLCAGYTITRAILSDAIALVRGDRFFTTDFTPSRLTNWGWADVQRNPKNPSFGAYLPTCKSSFRAITVQLIDIDAKCLRETSQNTTPGTRFTPCSP